MAEVAGMNPEAAVRRLREHWRLLVMGSLVAGVVAATGSFLLSRTFEAQCSILPVSASQADVPLGSSSFASYVSAFAQVQTQTELMAEILQSRTVREWTIESLGLIKAFELERQPEELRLESALRKLKRMTDVSMTRAGLIKLTVRASTPPFPFLHSGSDDRARRMASAIAGDMVQQLDRLVHEKSTSRARSSRVFIEAELAQTERNLAAAADSLREFQTRNMAVSLDEQTRKMVQNLAGLQAQIAVKEVTLEVMHKTMTANNPQVALTESEIAALRGQYEKYLLHDPRIDGTDEDIYIPLVALPSLAQQYADRLREVKVQETVHRLLNELYYQASIEEARDIPAIQVLDAPATTFKKVAPQRRLLVLLAMVLTFLALAGRVLLRERASQLRLAR